MQTDQRSAGPTSTFFTIDNLPMAERYGVWKEAIHSIFEVNADQDVRENDFRTSIEAHLLGSLMVLNVQSRAQKWSRGYDQIAGNGIDHFGIAIHKQGQTQCSNAKGTSTLNVGDLAIYDLTQPFSATVTDVNATNLVIPRPLIEHLLHQPDDHGIRFLPGSDPMVQILRELIFSIERHATTLGAEQTSVLEKSVPLLLANCLNNVSGENRDTLQERRNIVNMVRMRKYFRDNLGSVDLNPRQAALDLGVSRSKLYACFAIYGGVYNYVRDMRLRKALGMLKDPLRQRSSIYDIALECGFSSDASFIRAFREKYDVTPGELRNGGNILLRNQTGFDSLVNTQFESWIHALH